MPRLLLTLVLGVFATTQAALAQCTGHWLPGGGIAGTNGYVMAIAQWDPDGAGPLPSLVVMAGRFDIAGQASVAGIATWNPSTGEWNSLGSPLTGDPHNGPAVQGLAVMPDNSLIVVGDFVRAGDVVLNGIARWTGTTWLPLGSGLHAQPSASVSGIVVLPNGDIVVSGYFESAGEVPAHNIARWDGHTWSPLGAGLQYYAVLAAAPNGDVIAGTHSNSQHSCVVRWNGTRWTQLGSEMLGGTSNLAGGDWVASLTVLPNGDIIAGGNFSSAGGVTAHDIARWDGSTWNALGAGLYTPESEFVPGGVYSVQALVNGDIIAGGSLSLMNLGPEAAVVRWDGSQWTAIAGGLWGAAFALSSLPNGDLLIGGNVAQIGGPFFAGIASWDGIYMRALERGFFNGGIAAMTLARDGMLVASGPFASRDVSTTDGLARWNGVTWNPIPFGNLGTINALTTLPSGQILAGGSFSHADSTSARNIAQWDGSTWSALGVGLDGPVYATLVLSDGELLAGGNFNVTANGTGNPVVRWNGETWAPVGDAFTRAGWVDSPGVYALAQAPSGEIYAGGPLRVVNGGSRGIARLDGTIWRGLGSGLDGPADTLAVLPSGQLVVGGSFGSAGGVSSPALARWNGSSWLPMGMESHPGMYSTVRASSVLANGDLLIGGQFKVAGASDIWNVARWNGTTWSGTAGAVNGLVRAMTTLPDGELAVGGNFERAGSTLTVRADGSALSLGGEVSAAFARYVFGTDFNSDGVLDFFDYLDFVQAFASNSPYADFNGDAIVDLFDYLDFVSAFGMGC